MSETLDMLWHGLPLEWTLSITDVYMSNLAKAAAALGEVRDDER